MKNYKTLHLSLPISTMGFCPDLKISYLCNEKRELHHDSLPSLIIEDKEAKEDFYFKNGILFKKGEPAVIFTSQRIEDIRYHEKDELKKGFKIITDSYLKKMAKEKDELKYTRLKERLYNSLLFSFTGPDHINKMHDFHLMYKKNGKLHREDGPALIEEKTINQKTNICISWYLEGKLISRENKKL